MTQKQNILIKTIRRQTYVALSVMCALYTADAFGVAVTSRNVRPNASSRMPTMTSRSTSGNVSVSNDTDTSAPIVIDETIVDTTEIIENKSSTFDEVLTDIDNATPDSTTTTLADRIREQRALLDAADSTSTATMQMQTALATGQNACDTGLRTCMMELCGRDFSKCAGDTDTLWGDKMDRCRRDLPCTGAEYTAFAAEIKADRDTNARISMYNEIVDCGNTYNNCIIEKCGTTYSKCLGKKSQDAAITGCKQIAQKCISADNGLAARTMDVFGTLRVNAEEQVSRDEQRLYALRDMMSSACNRLGAAFDERTLDCVYTVNFYAGDNNTLYASKKAYAGSTFSCDQNWFGVDITTFMENAFRLTREQKSASSAMLGSGLGMGVGAVTSGAIDRAVDRHRAEQAVKDAQAEANGELTRAEKKAEKKAERLEKRADKKAARDEKKAEKKDNNADKGKKNSDKKSGKNAGAGDGEPSAKNKQYEQDDALVEKEYEDEWADDIAAIKEEKARAEKSQQAQAGMSAAIQQNENKNLEKQRKQNAKQQTKHDKKQKRESEEMVNNLVDEFNEMSEEEVETLEFANDGDYSATEDYNTTPTDSGGGTENDEEEESTTASIDVKKKWDTTRWTHLV